MAMFLYSVVLLLKVYVVDAPPMANLKRDILSKLWKDDGSGRLIIAPANYLRIR